LLKKQLFQQFAGIDKVQSDKMMQSTVTGAAVKEVAIWPELAIAWLSALHENKA